MGQTKIEWTSTNGNPGFTFNPWVGCAKVSAGCLNCYAEALMDKRYGRVKWGKGQARSRTSESNWKEPLKWNRNCEKAGTRAKVFCASLGDWLDDEVQIEWLADLLLLIEKTPSLDWLMLTKRPQNWSYRLHEVVRLDHDVDQFASSWLDGDCPPNVWIGTTIENQASIDERIPLLMKIPARIRFLSVEPLLEQIHFPDLMIWYNCLDCDDFIGHSGFGSTDCDHCGMELDDYLKPDWVIVGGESGANARPCQIEWIRDVVQQCKAADVPVFVKQLGSNPMQRVKTDKVDFVGGYGITDLKGGNIDEFPENLRIREFPGIEEAK